MPILDPPLESLDDRHITLIEQAVQAVDPKFDGLLPSSLWTAAAKAAEVGDTESERCFAFAGRILFAHIQGLDPRPPVSGTTLGLVADPSPNELELVKRLAEGISVPAARARIADLVWQKTNDFRFAEMASEAYFRAGAPFESPEEWPSCTRRYRRAVQLAVGGRGEVREFGLETGTHCR